jgi:multidrug transporter EmrE-like cation transporter
MISPATSLPTNQHKPFTRMQSIVLVFICTILGAAAQILMKNGVNGMDHFELMRAITNVPLMAGYCLYGINTLLLMLALRDGELSTLYPIIALTFVWVTMLSTYFFDEPLSLNKIAGIMVIVGGVTVMGKANAKR